MMPLKDWLKRGEKRPKQKKRIRPMSKKREREQAIYLKKRKAFLAEHPICQADACINGNWNLFFRPEATEIHHRMGRGKYLLDESTWVAVCRKNHNWIHSHPKEARQLGLLAP